MAATNITPAEAEALLTECRQKIDAIDAQLRELLNRRAGIVEGVVRAKQALQMPIYEPKREETVVRRVTDANPGPLSDEAFRHIFEIIMAEMRVMQQVYLDRQEEFAKGTQAKGTQR
jgi:chorismate mutase-like protein